jgi:hypothetical protein
MQHPNERITAAVAPVVDWRVAYPFVEAEAKAVLGALPEGARISTTELVRRIYDPQGPVDERVQTRIFKALVACSLHGLRDYVTLGEPGRVGSVENARRKLWGRPPIKSSPECCPHCKRPY